MISRKSRIWRTIPREASRKSPASPSTTSRTTRSTLSSRFSLCARERSLVSRCARREKTRRLVRAHPRVILPRVSPSRAEPSRAEPSRANHPPTTFAHLPSPSRLPTVLSARHSAAPTPTAIFSNPSSTSSTSSPPLASPSSPSLAPRRSSPHPSSRPPARPRPTDRPTDRDDRPTDASAVSPRASTTTVSERRPSLTSPVERGRREMGVPATFHLYTYVWDFISFCIMK